MQRIHDPRPRPASPGQPEAGHGQKPHPLPILGADAGKAPPGQANSLPQATNGTYLHPLSCRNTSVTTPPQSIFTLYSARNRPTKKTGVHPLSNSPTLSRLQHTCRIPTTVQCPLERRTDAPLRGMHTLYTFSMHQSIRLPVTIHGANIRQSVPYPAGSPPVQACPVSHSGKIRTGTDHYHRVLCAAFPDALRL